jgi:hypothetical protein
VLNIEFSKSSLIFKTTKLKKSPFISHNVRPLPIKINSTTLRIFFASRLKDDTPSPNFIDVDINNPKIIKKINKKILVKNGVNGSFDSDGITFTQITPYKGKYLIQYSGWKRSRYKMTIDMGIGYILADKNFNKFSKISDGPIIHKDIMNSLGVSASHVFREKNKFKLFYCRITKWIKAKHDYEMIYTVFGGESKDMFNWKFFKEPLIKQKYPTEVISAPEVRKIKGNYYMWYSYRGSINKNKKKFKIGFAFSNNGFNWKRMDKKNVVKISNIRGDWDFESNCYPSFYNHKSKNYVFYSGAGTGYEGFGYSEINQNF